MERKSLILGQADADLRQYMERALAEFEPVGTTGNGTELLELVEEKKPALVVMDLQLSGEDGLKILPRLRAGTAGKILVTSCVSAALLNQALELGADGSVSLPCSSETLRKTARALVNEE